MELPEDEAKIYTETQNEDRRRMYTSALEQRRVRAINTAGAAVEEADLHYLDDNCSNEIPTADAAAAADVTGPADTSGVTDENDVVEDSQAAELLVVDFFEDPDPGSIVYTESPPRLEFSREQRMIMCGFYRGSPNDLPHIKAWREQVRLEGDLKKCDDERRAKRKQAGLDPGPSKRFRTQDTCPLFRGMTAKEVLEMADER
jgi:hypothetical protein